MEIRHANCVQQEAGPVELCTVTVQELTRHNSALNRHKQNVSNTYALDLGELRNERCIIHGAYLGITQLARLEVAGQVQDIPGLHAADVP